MANDASKVAVAKPKVGGAFFFAPKGTAAPTDASTALASAFVNYGYVDSEGVALNEERNTQDLSAWGGDVVRTDQTTYKETLVLRFMQMELAVDKLVYGTDHVTGTETAYSVASTSDLPEEGVAVLETVMNDGTVARYVFPAAKVVSRSGMTLNGTAVAMPQVTFGLFPDSSGACHRRYVKAA